MKPLQRVGGCGSGDAAFGGSVRIAFIRISELKLRGGDFESLCSVLLTLFEQSRSQPGKRN